MDERTYPRALIEPLTRMTAMVATVVSSHQPQVAMGNAEVDLIVDVIVSALTTAYDAGVADGKEKAT